MWFKREMNPNVYNNLGVPLNERFWKNPGPGQARCIAQHSETSSFALFTERHNGSGANPPLTSRTSAHWQNAFQTLI
jgi:hypothetical protein